MKGLPKGGYCYRVHNYDQYLHDVGELRVMGYNIEDKWNVGMIKSYPNFRGMWLHVDCNAYVTLLNHSIGAERVPNLEFIINELPVLN